MNTREGTKQYFFSLMCLIVLVSKLAMIDMRPNSSLKILMRKPVWWLLRSIMAIQSVLATGDAAAVHPKQKSPWKRLPWRPSGALHCGFSFAIAG
jgi:short subunit fatty acids transporter